MFASIEKLIQNGNLVDALNSIRQLKTDNSIEKINIMLLESKILYQQGIFEDSYRKAQVALAEAKELSLDCLSIKSYTRIAWAMHRMVGKAIKAEIFIDEALELLDEGDFSNLSDIEIFSCQADLYYLKGKTLLRIGEYIESEDFLNKSLLVAEKLDSPNKISLVYDGFGVINQEKGLYETALDYFNLALKQPVDLKNFEFIDWKFGLLVNVGKTYFDMNYNDISLNYFTEALELAKSEATEFQVSYALFSLIQIHLALKNLEKANEYYTHLQDLNKKYTNQVVSLRMELAKALILKSSGKLRDVFASQEIFEKIIDADIFDFNYQIVAMRNLCEINILELKNTNSNDLKNNIKSMINDFIAMAEKQHFSTLKIDLMVLQAKLEEIDQNYEKALELLDDACNMAQKRGLEAAINRVKREKTNLQNHIEKLVNTINQNSVLADRIQTSQISSYLDDINKILNL